MPAGSLAAIRGYASSSFNRLARPAAYPVDAFQYLADRGVSGRIVADFGWAQYALAAFPESKAQTGEDLVRRADRALYRAKKTGKNRVELFWTDDPSVVHKIADLAGGPG